jgi:hypothetical protein
MKILKKSFFLLLVFSVLSCNSFAAFSDVPPTHENYEAITSLELNGIIQGYEDNTFRPDNQVNRAEAIKIIMEPLHETFPEVTDNPFPDVTPDLWYAKYVLQGKNDGIITGDGVTGNYEGARTVNLVEYLKILLLAYDVDLSNYQNQDKVIFSDVTDLNQWFIPYLYYASSTNLIHPDNSNNIYPGKNLTRGEVSEITYRLLVNLQGGEAQMYLSMAEAEMIKILKYLENDNVDSAEESSENALQYTNNALSIEPDENVVKAAVKIAESFDRLVKAYREGINENYTEVENKAKDAWNLASEAQSIDDSVHTLAEKIKTIAHDMAEDARAQIQ